MIKKILFILLWIAITAHYSAYSQCYSGAFRIEVSQPLTCANGNDGKIKVTNNTGETPADLTFYIDGRRFDGNLSYANRFDNTALEFLNLKSGVHEVEIALSANSACKSGTQTVTIAEVPKITFDYDLVHVDCRGEPTGSISVKNVKNFRGLKTELRYNLNKQSNQSGVFTNLSSGSYTLNVEDTISKCFSEDEYIGVTQKIEPAYSIEHIPFCESSNVGVITFGIPGVSPSLGSGDLSYSIHNGTKLSSDASFTGLGPGNYDLRVYHSSNCYSESIPVTITKYSKLQYNLNLSNPICGDDNGKVNFINVSGGNTAPPVTYVYHIDAVSASELNNDVPQGSHNSYIEDADGCRSDTKNFDITQLNPLTVNSVTTKDLLCYGLNDGNVTNISATGGNGSYRYELDGNAATRRSENFFEGLGAGNYSVRVLDASGCRSEAFPFTLNQPDQIQTTENIIKSKICYKERDGSFSILNVSGGRTGSTYEYSKDGGASYTTNTLFNNLEPKKYFLIVKATDPSGVICYSSPKDITIKSSDSITFTATPVIPTCHNGNDAFITINAQGGNPSYNFLVDGIAQTNNLTPGTKTIKVVDKIGCESEEQMVEIPNNIPLTINAILDPSECFGEATGEIKIDITSGVTGRNVEFTIDNGTNFSLNKFYYNLEPEKEYKVYGVDDQGCRSNTQTLYNTPKNPILEIDLSSLLIREPTCHNINDGRLVIPQPTGGSGNYDYSVSTKGKSSSQTFNGLLTGTYFVKGIDVNTGCETEEYRIDLDAPARITIGIRSISDKICFGTTTLGEVELSVTGGDRNYRYSADGINYQASNVMTGLPIGPNTVHVRDGNNCLETRVIEVSQLPEFTFAVEKTDNTCYNSDDGTLKITPTGGVGYGYRYSLNYGNFGENTNLFITGLPPDSYRIELKDANGCEASNNPVVVDILNKPEISIGVSSSEVSCYGYSDGSISITPLKVLPTDVLQYSIDNGTTTSSNTKFINLPARKYNVSAINQDGCSSNKVPVSIYGNNKLLFDYNPSTLECEDNKNVIEFVSARNCVGGCSYSIDSGFTFSAQNVFTDLSRKKYTLIIRDSVGCFSDFAQYDFGDNYGLSPIVKPVSCLGDENASINLQIKGGTPPYLIQWDDPKKQTTETARNLSPGKYAVLVKDYNNCELTSSFVIGKAPDSKLQAGFSLSNVFFEIVDTKISITDNSTDASKIYWKVGDQSYEDINFIKTELPKNPGEYIVKQTVEDTLGCVDTVSKIVFVRDVLTSLNQAAFSPNGDNLNDNFYPIRENVLSFSKCQLSIYDYYGNIQHKSEECYWNGKINSKPANAGTYSFILEYNIDDYSQVKTGRITLIR